MEPWPAKADTQLFLVSRSVGREALEHYLASNMFYIMPKDTELSWVQAIEYPTSPVTASWPVRSAKLPKLSISFYSKACDAERKLEDNIMYRDHVLEKYPHWTASDWQTHPSRAGDQLSELFLPMRLSEQHRRSLGDALRSVYLCCKEDKGAGNS